MSSIQLIWWMMFSEKEIQIKATRYHFLPTRMANIENNDNAYAGWQKEEEQLKHSHVAGKCKMVKHFGKSGSYS